MPGGDDKRFYRDLKRKIKKTGNKRRRAAAKKSIGDNPEEAHWTEFEFGKNSSEWLNGMDEDKTRERKDKHPGPGPVPDGGAGGP